MSRPAPIFVLGSQRSGTTLLQAVLGAHSRIAAAPELHYWFRVASLGPAWGDLRDPGVLRRVVHETLHPVVPLWADVDVDEEAVLARLRGTTPTFAAVLRATMDEVAHRAGKPRWSEKSPGQPLRPLADMFDDARFVHLVRDPWAVVASNLATPWGTGDARSLARRWRQYNLTTARVGHGLGPARYLQVRYEDLCEAPETTVARVCRFLDEPFEPAMVAGGRDAADVHSPIAQAWQRGVGDRVGSPVGTHRLSRVDRARVAAVVGATGELLGYPRARRRTRAAGHVANLLLLPAAAEEWRWWLRGWWHRNDPERLARLHREFQERNLARLRAEQGSGGPAVDEQV